MDWVLGEARVGAKSLQRENGAASPGVWKELQKSQTADSRGGSARHESWVIITVFRKMKPIIAGTVNLSRRSYKSCGYFQHEDVSLDLAESLFSYPSGHLSGSASK